MKLPSSVRVLGLCGLLAALCGSLGGFADMPWMLGIANALMLAANLYALGVGERR